MPFGEMKPSPSGTAITGSRNRPTFGITDGEPIGVRLGQLALVRRRLHLLEWQRRERDPVPAERLAIGGEHVAARVLDLLAEARDVLGGAPDATSSAVSPTEPGSAFGFFLRGVERLLRCGGLRLCHARAL